MKALILFFLRPRNVGDCVGLFTYTLTKLKALQDDREERSARLTDEAADLLRAASEHSQEAQRAKILQEKIGNLLDAA